MSKAEKKKVNPRKKPATMADIKRAKVTATVNALATAETIFLTVMLDKYGAEDHIKDIWDDVVKLSTEDKEGRVSIVDLLTVLEEEYGIDIVGKTSQIYGKVG